MTRIVRSALPFAAALVLAAACKTHRAPNPAPPDPPRPAAAEKAEKLPPEETQRLAGRKPEPPPPPPPAEPASKPLKAFVVLAARDQSIRTDPLLERLIHTLHATGRFTLANRGQIGDLLGEQDFGEGGRVSEAGRTKIGEVTGAAYLVVATAGPNQDSSDPNPQEMILNLSVVQSGVVAASARTTGRDVQEAADKAARSLAEEVKARLREGTLAGPGPN